VANERVHVISRIDRHVHVARVLICTESWPGRGTSFH
jgi:hypothetical protein